jgi:lipopolysaccharide transport system ATP-binding protein
MSTVIQVENISKLYRLGQIGSKTLSQDLNRWWSRFQGRPDPTLKIGQKNLNSSGKDSEFVWSLKDISFEVRDGEVLGIIGKNGAGKSTLLKILSRVTAPTSGSVKIKGRVASLLEVGTGFHPELTGRENIYLNGAILGMTKAEIKRKFDEIVDFSGVAQYIDTPVKRFSSGMYVRLAFAVAAHLEPEILIVDEVLAVGDAEFQKKCLGKMKDVSKEGRTVLFVSHNMGAIRTLCERALLLRDGVIAKNGEVKECIEAYLKDDSEISETGIIPLNFKRNSGLGTAKFIKVGLLNPLGEPTKTVYYRSPLRIQLEIEAFEFIRDALFSVMIGTTDGQRIIYQESLDGFNGTVSLEKGSHSLTLEINTSLLPGTYSIYLGLGHLNGKTIDWLERVYDFNVLKTSLEKNNYYRWDESHGYVLGDAKWTLETAMVNHHS